MKITNQPGFETVKTALLVLVVLLAASNLATLYWLSRQDGQSKAPVQTQATSTPAVDTDGDGLPDVDEIGKFKTDPAKADTDGDGFTDRQEIDTGHNPLVAEAPNAAPDQITVEWQEWPGRGTGGSQLYDFAKLDELVKRMNKDNPGGPETQAYEEAMQFYKVGTVTSGKYAGKPLYIMAYTEVEGPSFGPELYHVVGQGTSSVMLVRGKGYEVGDFFKALFVVDADTAIANLETPDKVAIPGSKLSLYKTTSTQLSFIDVYSDAKKLFEYAQGEPMYFSSSRGCFFVRAEDGTARVYELELPILDKTAPGSPSGNMPRYNPQLIAAAFDGQAQAAVEYSVKAITRCNVFDCYNYPAYIKGSGQLKPAGKFGNGDTIWVLGDEKLKDDGGNEVLRSMYDAYYPGYDEATKKEKPKMSFADFLAGHPIIYWQDPFGRFLEMRKAEYESGAECGKPVIYFYPTKTTTVSVLVAPTGGITYSEPAYGQGWRVMAEPSGRLTDLETGRQWPYLFWEGRADNYRLAEEGFVVARADIDRFLRDKLAVLGLNGQETADFMEFWLPRMQAKPYYFIHFVPQSQFDKMAPLKVEPRPDTVIRVFMDFKALEAPIKVRQQKLATPARRGFTVVEWGGELRD